MRTFLWWFFVAVVCTPMALMFLIAAEVHYPRLDRLTLAMPYAIRSIVGEVSMSFVGFDKDSARNLDRVLKLDPLNPRALSRRCSQAANAGSDQSSTLQAIPTCQKAVAQDPSELNLNALGLAQEHIANFCDAEDSFTSANSKVNARDAFVLSNLGRAALKCGHTPSAVASFELAEIRDQQNAAVAKPDPDDEEDAQQSLRTDREWLIVAYGKNNELPKAAAMCTQAHPTWKSCSCAFDDKGVKCLQPSRP